MDATGRFDFRSDRSRPPAVAGLLYPADADELGRRVNSLLAHAGPAPARTAPKALLVPHGGLQFSGSVAARAFGALAPVASAVRRVVLIGPVHHRRLAGLWVPEAEAFATPLGSVPVDEAGIARLLSLGSVRRGDAPHRREHGLEMQLPFLQVVLDDFAVVPILAGDVAPHVVAEALERIWGGPETLVIATSDLALHRPYREALAQDAHTAQRIVDLDPDLDAHAACGSAVIAGLLQVARARAPSAALMDLGNSADAGGDTGRVVGYGAFGFYESAVTNRA